MATDYKANPARPIQFPHPGRWPLPAKGLVTMVVVMMSLGMVFAGGQVVIHDIIPTFSNMGTKAPSDHTQMTAPAAERGDLFGDTLAGMDKPPFYQSAEFVFALKFTHIHVFGMSAIFILMGTVIFFLHLSPRVRTWLIVLPFLGVIIDLAAVWLKLFIHPAFFWLHIPGGVLFVTVFALDVFFSMQQIWGRS